jgi:hypothetical protein
MLYNPPSGQAGATVALPDEREDYPQPSVPFDQSSVFTPPDDEDPQPQVQQPQGQVQGQVQGQAQPQIPIDPSLLDMPPHPMAQQHQHMMHPARPDYLLNGNVADYGLQSAPMQSGNWQQNQQHPNPNGNGASRSYANSPPDLSFSRSSHNASGTELVASPTQAYYNGDPNSNFSRPAPIGTATASRDPTLGGLNSRTKAQSQRPEVTVSQQSFLNVDENGAGPSGTVDDSNDHDHDSLYDWANDRCTYTLDGQSQSDAGPSTFTGAYDESLE